MNNFFQSIKHYSRHGVLIHKNLPVFPKVLSGYFKTLVLKKNVLRTLELTVTADCNVACEMCYAERIRQNKNIYLTPADYHMLWLQAKKLGAFSVILSGGEPLMRKDLFDIIGALEPHKTIIALVTNGTLLTMDILRKLKNAGVNVIHLSLNSTDPHENDKMRDFDGHFKKTLYLSRQAKALGFEVCLSTIVSHGELNRAFEVASLAQKHKLGVVFSLACPTGKWAGAREHLLTSDEWEKVDHFMKATPFVRSDWTINFSLKTECPAGREKICISPYGDVMGCGMNFISLGNVRKTPLKAIWNRMCEWEPFKKRSSQCLIALDQTYLNEYLLPIVHSDRLPIPIEDHPVHPQSAKKAP